MDIAEKRRIQLEKDEAEIAKWSKLKRRRRSKFYIFYSLLIFCLAYIIDEIATNINSFVSNDVLMNFFDENFTQYTLVMTVCSGIAVFSFFFRALADRFGRKPFLVINLFGMALGMFLCFVAPILPVYVIGITISFFFTPCDVQVLYIIEVSSDKRRAINLAISKAIGIMGIVLVPLLGQHITINGWQGAFLVPSIVGLAVGFLGLFFIQESEVFLDCKISMLEDRIRAGHRRGRKRVEKKINGGIIPALKYIFSHKVFLWLFLAMFVFAIASIGQANYALIIESEIYSSITGLEAENAYIIYPFITAAVILINGVISDIFGRRIASIFDGAIALIGTILFIIGSRYNWSGYVIGVFLGAFIGGYLSGIDTMNVMCSEEAPTSLRSSIMSVISVSLSAGSLIATGVTILFDNIIEKLDIGLLCVIMIPPALFVALFVLLLKIPETKGRSLVGNLRKKKGA